jgi:FkbM family methyltransferase
MKKPGIDGIKDLEWDPEDEGLYGYYDDKDNNSGPVGDWFASHKSVIEDLSSKRGRSVIQAGGAFGMYPLLLNKYYDNVYTFEGSSNNFKYLRENLKGTDVNYYHKILGNKYELATITTPSHKNKGMNRIGDLDPNDYTHMMKIDGYDFHNVDLIWLDVEGYEYEAIMGARETIEAYKPFIGVERPCQSLINFLEEREYSVYKKSKMDVFFKFDGVQ